MRAALPNDHKLVVDLLARAFQDNPSVNAVIGDGPLKWKRIDAIMDYAFKMSHLFGRVYLSDDRKACALTLYPHQQKTSLQSLWLLVQLVSRIGISTALRVMKRDKPMQKIKPLEDMVYLVFIGVDPGAQGKGIGGSLLQRILADARKEHLPVYLETSVFSNTLFYQKYGFDIYAQLDLGYILYFLRRP